MLPLTASDLKKGTDLLGKESICAHPDWVKEVTLESGFVLLTDPPFRTLRQYLIIVN